MATNTVAAHRQVSLPPTSTIVDERRSSIKAIARQASVEPAGKIVAETARARSESVEPEILTPKATSPPPQRPSESREASLEPSLILVSSIIPKRVVSMTRAATNVAHAYLSQSTQGSAPAARHDRL